MRAMAKEKKARGEPAGPEDVTTVKCYVRMRKTITQLAGLLDVNQQDVLARYEKFMDEDLRALMARRLDELKRRGGSPP